jgi:apolipoprotein N-acyltransferase
MNLLLVLISALFYVLSFPLWNYGFLAFFALAPLFGAVEGARSTARGTGYGIIWSALMSTGLGYWLYPTLINHFNVWPPKAALFFLLCVVLPSCLIYGGVSLVYRFVYRDHPFWYALVLPSLWTLGEYLKELIPVLLPWGAVGYAVLPFTQFVQIADVAGVHGLTFLVVLINALIWLLCLRVQEKTTFTGVSAKKSKSIFGKNKAMTVTVPLALLVFATAVPLIYGMIRVRQVDAQIQQKTAAHPPVHAVLVQGNFSLHERWSGMGFFNRLQVYLEMSTQDIGQMGHDTEAEAGQPNAAAVARPTHAPGNRVIVWPETTLNAPVHLDDRLFRQIMDYIGEETLLISGGLMQNAASGRTMNSAYLISGKGMLTRYDKNILLPYAETSMMFDWLGRYYTAPEEFAPGGTPPCIDTPHGVVGASICFEILYPRYIARSVFSGADFLVNMSNDGWFGDSAMPYMHLNAARMRAIENRRFLLRAANNGISAVIAPDGRIIRQTGLFQKQRIDADFVYMDMVAPYTRFGDWLVFFSAFVLGMALLRLVFDRD